eukprot:gene6468-biopygen5405
MEGLEGPCVAPWPFMPTAPPARLARRGGYGASGQPGARDRTLPGRNHTGIQGHEAVAARRPRGTPPGHLTSAAATTLLVRMAPQPRGTVGRARSAAADARRADRR